ncbi:MAG: hypothetical protein CMI16_13260 [Opitutaceae bacterium]|nr:hypothetical protein [Opitutaceae bacterium]
MTVAVVRHQLRQLAVGTGTKRSRDGSADDFIPTESVRFFQWNDFYVWKALVLQELKNDESDAYKLARKRQLPIYSTKQNRWFGVSGIGLTRTISYVREEGEGYYVRLLVNFLQNNSEVQMEGRTFTLGGDKQKKSFSVYKTKLHVDNEYKNGLHLAALYPRDAAEILDWDVRGGDLLHACGVLFALLTDTDCMYVQEGPHVGMFETAVADEHLPGYKYYNKFILGPAKPAQHREASSDEEEQETKQEINTDVLYVDSRSVEPLADVSQWLWTKKRQQE